MSITHRQPQQISWKETAMPNGIAPNGFPVPPAGSAKGIVQVARINGLKSRTLKLTPDALDRIAAVQAEYLKQYDRPLSFAAAVNSMLAGTDQTAQHTRETHRWGGR